MSEHSAVKAIAAISRAHRTGSMCVPQNVRRGLWKGGNAEMALRELAPLVSMLEDIDPESDDAVRTLHLKLRWLVGWLHDSTSGPTGLKRALHFGSLAALDADYPEGEQRQSGRLEDIKLLLMVVGLRQNFQDLFPDLNWSKTTLGFHIVLGAAEFDLAVEDGTPNQIVHALLQLAAASAVAQREKVGTPISQIDKIGKLASHDLEDSGVNAVFVHALALAAYFGARNREDKLAFCEALLVEIQKRLKVTTPELELWRKVLVDTSTADSADQATWVFRCTLAPDDEVLHPTDIINRQLSLLQCAAACGCGARMVKRLHTLFADEWAFVVEHQRFLLSQPSLHVLALESAIKCARQEEVGALANLLQCGARALGSRLPMEWIELAEKLGGKPRD